MGLCFYCFNEIEDCGKCPYCGKITDKKPKEPIHLYPGTVLAERYIIGKSVGEGGFGIVYRAWDTKLEMMVAVKEFFASRLMQRAGGTKDVIVGSKPEQIAEFEYRKKRFLAEARNMAKFSSHNSIVNVYEYFEENKTAYLVMEFLDGITFSDYLKQFPDNKIDHESAVTVMSEICTAVSSLNEQSIIHCDVAPDNIFICPHNVVKLLDLGAAKLAETEAKVIDITLKPGFSPPEQYNQDDKQIGTWTDVYAIGATLYLAVTGIKPDESTNRRIEDTLVPPHEVDSSIPENLSNAIMKAMAIERHMRFKSADSFQKAIAGEKKVVTLAKEKKRKKRNRFVGIVAALLILAVVFGIVFKSFSNKRNAEVLEPSKITVWISCDENSTEPSAMETICKNFKDIYPDVEIDLKVFTHDEYESKLREAAEKGQLPTLFESSGVSEEILKKATNLDNVLKSSQAINCLFLDDYENYYDDKKQMPLGIEVPMAYVITNGAVSLDYTEKRFNSIKDFGKDVLYAVAEYDKDIVAKNFGKDAVENAKDSSLFFNSNENECALLLSSTMSLNDVREKLTAYPKAYVAYDSDEIQCEFVYEWSIGNGNKDEIKAAERLLSWMLGNSYQSSLMISGCNDGQIPVDKQAFMSKCEIKNLSELKELYTKFVFKKNTLHSTTIATTTPIPTPDTSAMPNADGNEISVENIVGKEKNDAESMLEKQGFKVTILEKYDNTVANGLVVSQNPIGGSDLLKDSEVTIYVSKGKRPVKVNFDANGGNCAAESITVYFNENYGELPTPKKEFCKFKGWYMDDTYEKQVTSNTVLSVTDDHTLIAKWKENEWSEYSDKIPEDVSVATHKIIHIYQLKEFITKTVNSSTAPTVAGYTLDASKTSYDTNSNMYTYTYWKWGPQNSYEYKGGDYETYSDTRMIYWQWIER